MFYDLTELQQHANRLYGFSAQKTLDIARALYETYKLISYGSIPGDVSSRSDLRDPGDLIFVRITMTNIRIIPGWSESQ